MVRKITIRINRFSYLFVSLSFISFFISFVLSQSRMCVNNTWPSPVLPTTAFHRSTLFPHGWNTRFIDQLEFSSKQRGAAVRPRSCGRFTAAILQSYPLDSIISSSFEPPFDDRFADFGLKGCRTRMEILARIGYTIVKSGFHLTSHRCLFFSTRRAIMYINKIHFQIYIKK